MQEHVTSRPRHIKDAIDQIETLLADKTVQDMLKDRFLRAAYERFLEIVSEASRHIPASDKQAFPDLPWRQIADIGNHLRHGYTTLDAAILWDIHEKGELKRLHSSVTRLLEQHEKDR